MVERMVRIHEVRGSIPLISTRKNNRLFITNKRLFFAYYAVIG